MRYKIVIPGIFYGRNRTFPDLNNYIAACNRRHVEGNRLKQEYAKIASIYIRKTVKGIKIAKPLIVTYIFYEVDRKRDLDNCLCFTSKCFLDALQFCEVIPNDGWNEIKEIRGLHYVDKDNPRIEIILEEIDREDATT